jgi:hypothetical protein
MPCLSRKAGFTVVPCATWCPAMPNEDDWADMKDMFRVLSPVKVRCSPPHNHRPPPPCSCQPHTHATIQVGSYLLQKLTTKLQETHEVISSLFVGLLEECKAELRALSTTLGEVGRELSAALLGSINEV